MGLDFTDHAWGLALRDLCEQGADRALVVLEGRTFAFAPREGLRIIEVDGSAELHEPAALDVHEWVPAEAAPLSSKQHSNDVREEGS